MSQSRTRGQREESHPGFIRQISSPGRVSGGVVLLVLLASWSLNGFAIDYHFDVADASSPRSALSEAIYQNTPGNHQWLGAGLDWDRGTESTKTTPAPSGFSAITGWGQVYPEAGATVSPNNASDIVQLRNFTTYVHLTDRTWVEAQNQAQVGIQGAHYVADFSGDAHIPFATNQTLSDGSMSMDAPPAGYNDHFWPTARGTFTPGTVDGIFVQADMKTNDPNANLVAQLGADWWLDSAAPYAGLDANNTAVGLGNWIKLTTRWQTIYYTSLSPQQLKADPPPKLLGSPPLRQ